MFKSTILDSFKEKGTILDSLVIWIEATHLVEISDTDIYK